MTPPTRSGMREGGIAGAVVEDRAEEVGVVLAEAVEAGLQGVAGDSVVMRSLRAGVGGGAVGGGGDGRVVGTGVVVGAVAVEEG